MQNKSKENFHVPRQFCEYSKKDKIVDENSLLFHDAKKNSLPEDDNEFVGSRSWDYYIKYKSIVLLGPPRQGKTSEF